MTRREPLQARSVASTHRMLDAAEQLLTDGGPDALTVDAVVTRAGTSVGSFYARFGDRQGLLVAMQDRFLGRLVEALDATVAAAASEPDLRAAVEVLVGEFLKAFREHRAAFTAYLLNNRSDPHMRARGAQASRQAADSVGRLLLGRRDQVRHPDLDLAADFTYRALFALATQTVLFDDREVTGRRHQADTWTAQTTALLLAHLQAPPPAVPTNRRQPLVDSAPELAPSADRAEAETAVDDYFRAGGEAGLG